MCYRSRDLPLAVPLAARAAADGEIELEYTLALAKATTLRAGEHRSTNGEGAFSYPIGRGWVRDPHFQPKSHTTCLHFSTPGDAISGGLDSYGSHRLIAFPSTQLYGDRKVGAGRCWHDGAALPVCCLSCDAGDDPSALAAPEFWAALRERFSYELYELGDDLFRAQAVLPALEAPGASTPLPLEGLLGAQLEGSMDDWLFDHSNESSEVLARWEIEGAKRKIIAVVRRVPKGWWLENEYPIDVYLGGRRARAILCEDGEHGLYFYVGDREFGRRLTGVEQPVALVTPVAAEVVAYLDRVPGRWALPKYPEFPPVYCPRFRDPAGAMYRAGLDRNLLASRAS